MTSKHILVTVILVTLMICGTIVGVQFTGGTPVSTDNGWSVTCPKGTTVETTMEPDNTTGNFILEYWCK